MDAREAGGGERTNYFFVNTYPGKNNHRVLYSVKKGGSYIYPIDKETEAETDTRRVKMRGEETKDERQVLRETATADNWELGEILTEARTKKIISRKSVDQRSTKGRSFLSQINE